MPSLLKLTGIHKAFGGVAALSDVSFELLTGEVHALIGENGAGKSTLVKIITGAHQPDAGTMELAGRQIVRLDPLRARELGIAAIYQQPALFPDLSVAENIALGREPPRFWQAIRWCERRERALRALEEVRAQIDPDTEAGRLTMPQQQLVEIARALSVQARVLILDEPTASLSDRETEHLFSVIGRLKEQGVGMIYISHRLDELPRIAGRVTVLRDGCLVGTARVADTNRGELIRMMVGRELSTLFPTPAAPAGDMLLEVRGLSCRAESVRDINLSVRRGEIVGLAGLVGAGRTELARVLFGLSPADEGEIRFRGRNVTIDSPQTARALGIAYVPEDRRRHGVIPELSLAANMSLARLPALSRAGFLDFSRERRLAGDLVGRLGIKAPSIDAAAGELSGGNQQKVALARWMATSPALLILDEPTQGIDVHSKAEIHRLMCDLASQGLGILMISSDLPEVLGMSSRIAVMHGGRIVGELDRASATQERVLELALGHVAGGVWHDAATEPSNCLVPGLWLGTHCRRGCASILVGPNGHDHMIQRYRWELAILAAWLAMLALLAVFAPAFFSRDQLRAIFVNSAPVILAATGATLVMLAGQIDISIGSLFSLCGVLAGLAVEAGWPLPAAAVLSLACGALLGALNGALVAFLRLPAIVVTLSTLVAVREGLRYFHEGRPISNLPPDFQWFGLSQTAGQWLVVAIAAAVAVMFAWGLANLAGGRAIYATGSAAEAARLVGIRPQRTLFGVFVASGVLAALASLLNDVRFSVVDPNAGNGLEMQAIAAVVVGGTAVTGGRGTILGTVLGVLLLTTIGPALEFLHIEAHWERAIQGAVILAAVSIAGRTGSK